MTPSAAASEIERIARSLKPNLDAAERNAQRQAIDIAQRYSSGPFTKRDLSKLAHPFSVVHQGNLNPSVINIGTGLFRTGWRVEDSGFVNGVRQSHLVNDSKEASFLLQGTKSMITRPIGNAVSETLGPIRFVLLRQAIQDTCAGEYRL